MFNYAVRLTHDAKTDTYEVSCRDLPLLHSVGDTVEAVSYTHLTLPTILLV